MYSSLHIQGFRGLRSFSMKGLGRINLLVGTNNCGKTSILECIELLRSAGQPSVLESIARRRGELGRSDDGQGLHPNVAHLFVNRDFNSDICIDARGANHAWNDRVSVRVEDQYDSFQEEAGTAVKLGPLEQEPLALAIEWQSIANRPFKVSISPDGLISFSQMLRRRNGQEQSVQTIAANGMTADTVVRLFDEVVLTDREAAIVDALRTIEPEVERLATVADKPYHFRDSPSGVFLKFNKNPERVPIGSVGNGMCRLLGLAVSLANARNGVLLVDEIDTGLHYTVMEKMWGMISERAAALSVQVFATTHSRDCYESLASVVEPELSRAADVTIQRIEPDRQEAVRIHNEAIAVAERRGIEVR